MTRQMWFLAMNYCTWVVADVFLVGMTVVPFELELFSSAASKSNTNNLVSSVPLRLPTAHTSLVLEHRTRHTTPPLPPLSSDTKLRKKSPVLRSQIFTVPSSEEVITNFLLNCKHVTALWCLFDPAKHQKTVAIAYTRTRVSFDRKSAQETTSTKE